MNELKDLIRTNFKRYRLQSKLSQVELAKLLEVRPSAISNWESGRNSRYLLKRNIGGNP